MKWMKLVLPVLFVAATLGLSATPYVQACSVEEEEETQTRFESDAARLTPGTDGGFRRTRRSLARRP
jgi:hypothetical protein